METDYYIKLNDHSTNYLCHGVPFELEFSIPPPVKYVFLHYKQTIPFQNYHKARVSKPGKLIFWNFYKYLLFLKICKPKDKVSLRPNYYFPYLTFYFVNSIFPLKFSKKRVLLKIDFINALYSNIKLTGLTPFISTKKTFPGTIKKINFNVDLPRFKIARNPLEVNKNYINSINYKFELNKKLIAYD